MSDVIEQHTNKQNLLQLVYLRGIAIGGQLATILIVHFGLHITLPLGKMLAVVALLTALNLLSWRRYRTRGHISDTSLFCELLLDTAALTTQLYLSGGAENPFVTLFLLQVIIGAVLLRRAYAWALLGVTCLCYLALTFHSRDLQHMYHYHLGDFFNLHVHGMLISYILAALLLVYFVTRINSNLEQRDRQLARLSQQSLEEQHLLRMGLLAAGAAHELGTPLTTLSVILKDWQSLPPDKEDAAQDIETMQRELERCKGIVSGILLSAGQVRGEAAEVTRLHRFLDSVVAEWIAARNPGTLEYHKEGEDIPIVSDRIIRQALVNLLDNALEASPHWVGIDLDCDGETITIRVTDQGAGFRQDILDGFGTPYLSSKEGHGRGLGLFLVTSTLRQLGGQAWAENSPEGARVTLTLPRRTIEAEAA